MGPSGWRVALLLAAAAPAGCYSPTAVVDVPCAPSLACPSGQVCYLDAPGGPRCVASPSMSHGVSSDAIEVSAGGQFPFDARGALDELEAPCGGGGPDVFFRISLPAPEVVYLDAIGASGEPAIAVHEGGCAASLGASLGCAARTCGADAQGAWRLPAGEHCIVLDHAAWPVGPGQLTVVRGGRDGDPLAGPSGMVTGDTCDDDDSNDASCDCGPAKDHHYFFTVCPGQAVMANIETCAGADWDTVLQFRDAEDDSLGCTDDSCSGTQSRLTRSITGPGLFWAIIDGCDECGAYTMRYNL